MTKQTKINAIDSTSVTPNYFSNQAELLGELNTKINTVIFLDRPCGHGKTSDLLKSFQLNQKYFVVVPTRAEIARVIAEAVVPFDTPIEGLYTDAGGKTRTSLLMGLSDLINDGENIVCTHALFDKVNINEFAIDSYNVIIDEVFDCVKGLQGPKDDTFLSTYIDDGLAVVGDNGKVIPTDKWVLLGDDAYAFKLLEEARRGRLHRSGEGFYVTVVPVELFTKGRTCHIMTYLAEGSLMALYLDKLNIPYEIQKDNLIDRNARIEAKRRLSIRVLDLKLAKAQGYKRQGNWSRDILVKIANKLHNTRTRKMKGVCPNDIIITCRKDLWYDKNGNISTFAKKSRLNKVNWVHKSTKGTNAYRNCTHAIYIYDLNLHPSVKKFLGVTQEQEDHWKQSEFIQWLYRTDLRNQNSNKEINLYVSSEAMHDLIEDWLSND